MQTDKPDWT